MLLVAAQGHVLLQADRREGKRQGWSLPCSGQGRAGRDPSPDGVSELPNWSLAFSLLRCKVSLSYALRHLPANPTFDLSSACSGHPTPLWMPAAHLRPSLQQRGLSGRRAKLMSTKARRKEGDRSLSAAERGCEAGWQQLEMLNGSHQYQCRYPKT